ncbi:MAG: MarR family transcriptional regulator [Flavobacteriales bacterium]|nr:MarR family transcriptional regulator [Flavobacteriales bacterium]
MKCENQKLCEQSFGRALAVITKNYWGALSKKLEKHGLDRYFSVLIAIDKAQTKCTQQSLCNLLKIDKVGMVRQLDYLVYKGFIERTVNQNDRREHLINLTKKGKEFMPFVHKGINELNSIVFNGFSKQEQDSFRCSIEKMILNLEPLPINEINFKIKKLK